MAQFSRKGYFKPTPKKLRKIGDSLLAIFGGYGFVNIIEAYNEPDKQLRKVKLIIAGSAVALGIVGKFFTNFFKEDDKPTREEDGSQPGN